MPHEVVIEDKVVKKLKRLPRDVLNDEFRAIRGLAETPRPRGTRKIRGEPDGWRIVA